MKPNKSCFLVDRNRVSFMDSYQRMLGGTASVIAPVRPPVFVDAQPDAVPGRVVVTKPGWGR